MVSACRRTGVPGDSSEQSASFGPNALLIGLENGGGEQGGFISFEVVKVLWRPESSLAPSQRCQANGNGKFPRVDDHQRMCLSFAVKISDKFLSADSRFFANCFPKRRGGRRNNLPDFKRPLQFFGWRRNVNQRQIAQGDLRANTPQLHRLVARKNHFSKSRANGN